MKIVEIPSFFPPYGGEFCLEQSKALSALGHDVTILANVQLSIRRSLKDYLLTSYRCRTTEMEKITVYRSDMRGIPLCIRPNVTRWCGIIQKMFARYVNKNGLPDIIHAHCAKWAGYAASKISEKYGIPFVITEHLSSMIFKKEFGDNFSKAWQIPLLKSAYKAADMVIPVSAELVDDIACYFGKDYKWTAISNTIDIDFFAYRDRKPADGRMFRFCCLANFIPLKGYDVLFKAFDKLAAEMPDVELYIAGKFTDGKECAKIVKSMMNSSKVTICGELDKNGVRRLLYQCDCLVLASRSESQGLVLLEAMSTGIPAISTDCIPQSIRINDGTYIVPVDDAEELKACMHKVAIDNNINGRHISKKVASLASPQYIGEKLSELFLQIVKQHKS